MTQNYREEMATIMMQMYNESEIQMLATMDEQSAIATFKKDYYRRYMTDVPETKASKAKVRKTKAYRKYLDEEVFFDIMEKRRENW